MRHAKIEKIESEERLETYSTRITIDLTQEDMANCPFPPTKALFGENWLLFQHRPLPVKSMEALEIEPEGVAMQLLRLAWVAAWREQQNRK